MPGAVSLDPAHPGESRDPGRLKLQWREGPKQGRAAGAVSNRRGRGGGAEFAEDNELLCVLRASSASSAVKDSAYGALQLSGKRGS
jgi:hypothetical protein